MLHLLPRLNVLRWILASGSPRRKEILTSNLGLKFEVVVSTFDESLDKAAYASAAEYVAATAEAKAREVSSRLATRAEGERPHAIIAADTVRSTQPQSISLEANCCRRGVRSGGRSR
jgi:septum formation protein